MLKHISLFREVESSARHDLETGMITRAYPRGTIVVHQGDDSQSLYLVIEGRLRIFITGEDGKELTLGSLQAGDYFGEMALLDDEPRMASALVTEDARLAMLNRRHFLACLERHPAIARVLLRTLSARLRLVTDSLGDMAMLDVYGRIARVLLQHAEEIDGLRMTERLTHQDIANLVGASREMVSRILKDLRKGGYITTAGKRIVINRDLPARW